MILSSHLFTLKIYNKSFSKTISRISQIVQSSEYQMFKSKWSSGIAVLSSDLWYNGFTSKENQWNFVNCWSETKFETPRNSFFCYTFVDRVIRLNKFKILKSTTFSGHVGIEGNESADGLAEKAQTFFSSKPYILAFFGSFFGSYIGTLVTLHVRTTWNPYLLTFQHNNLVNARTVRCKSPQLLTKVTKLILNVCN